ncbi:MAG: tRNA (N(6)-L-threonylcarbamoyladenosine(37)-C(2))-methylthiotransferase MtaB [Gammaproteobacteria bacterium]|nr:tRNA (N(6)-L-threonylcarbamoyladenosine(37)-C(2))-methylthiotransferase MtaB [Gammaproteobacteria bacterium]
MNNEKNRFKIISMGCKVNYYEAQALASFLKSKGFIEVSEKEEADLSILNSCAVTEEASRKSKQVMRRMINESPNGVSVMTGCLAQVDDDIKNINGLNIILGSSRKGRILEALDEYNNTHNQVIDKSNNIFKSEYDLFTVGHFDSHTRAFLKVEDGCDKFCTYCLIPFARGNVRSKPLDLCVEEVKQLVANGHKEVVITGIHTGAYGKDLGITLYDLLKELDKIDGLLRIRISSIEINQLTDDILNLTKESHKLVPHFHIPIQAASNHVLKAMNRHYDVDYFIKRVKEIREIMPNVSLTTDYIVGFPTESDEDFKESLDNLNIIKFDMIHTFPYSLRKGTPAAKLKQVDPKVKKERSKQILELSKKGYQDLVKRNIGNTLDCIFEEYKEGYIYGHTSNYIYCKALGAYKDLNKLINVKIKDVDDKCALVDIIE